MARKRSEEVRQRCSQSLEEQIQTYSEAQPERISLRVYSRPANSPPQDAVATHSGHVYTHTRARTPTVPRAGVAPSSRPLPWADHASSTIFCSSTNGRALEGAGQAGKCWILKHRDERRQPGSLQYGGKEKLSALSHSWEEHRTAVSGTTRPLLWVSPRLGNVGKGHRPRDQWIKTS